MDILELKQQTTLHQPDIYADMSPLHVVRIRKKSKIILGGKEVFIVFFKKKNTPVTYNEKYLRDEINMTKDALNAAYSNFDNATDPDLIDCYIYQVNSEQKRYKYLLERARECETL